MFYEFLNIFGGRLISIDISNENLRTCELAIKSFVPRSGRARLILLQADSAEALAKMEAEEIDLLYLDSLDFNKDDPKRSMLHHLMELISSERLLKRSSDLLVAVDDNFDETGKGRYIKNWAMRTGQKILHDKFQIIIRVVRPDELPRPELDVN